MPDRLVSSPRARLRLAARRRAQRQLAVIGARAARAAGHQPVAADEVCPCCLALLVTDEHEPEPGE